MGADPKVEAMNRPGFFTRLFSRIKARFRRLFGKKEEPNIYPFF